MSNGCSPGAWSKDSLDPGRGGQYIKKESHLWTNRRVVIWQMSSGHLGVLSAKSTLRNERQPLSKRTI